jgi:hypothetical protein
MPKQKHHWTFQIQCAASQQRPCSLPDVVTAQSASLSNCEIDIPRVFCSEQRKCTLAIKLPNIKPWSQAQIEYVTWFEELNYIDKFTFAHFWE